MSQSFLQDVPAVSLTSDTIKRMYELIDQGKTDPKFQELVYSVTSGLANKDYKGEISRIFNWAKNTIRYTRDPYGVELVQDVWSTLNRQRADCDDFTILIGAACEVMGAPVRITTVSTAPDLEPSHVYPEAYVNGSWVPLDATVSSSYPGWKPTTGITDRKYWSRSDVGISGYDTANVEGLGMSNANDASFSASQGMLPVDLTPGIPNDISHTFATGVPGSQVIPGRRQPGAPSRKIARYADLTENPAPGDEVYDGPMPIRSFPLPENIWSLTPRPSVPMKLDPWGHMKPWKTDPNAILPKPNVSEDKYMSNLAGINLGQISDSDMNQVASGVQQDTANAVASGAITPAQAPAHAANLVDAVTSGDMSTVSKNQNTANAVMAVAKKSKHAGGVFSDPSLSWIPRAGGVAGMRGLGGLNLGAVTNSDATAVVNAISTDIKNHVASGNIPAASATAAASKAVDAVQTGDTSVVNPAVMPATHATVTKIKKKHQGIRDSSGAYSYDNQSTDWIPRNGGVAGLGQTSDVAAVKAAHPALFSAVQREVYKRLPAALKKHGLHPGRITGTGAPAGTHRRHMNGLGDFGQTTSTDQTASNALAAQITTAAAGSVSPTDPNAIANVVGAGITAALQVAGVAPATPVAPASTFSFSSLFTGWTVPLLIGAGVIGIGYYLKTRRKGKYRSNPKDAGMNKLLILGLVGGGAYLIMKKAAPAAAAAPTSSNPIMSALQAGLKALTGGGSSSPAASVASAITGGAAKATTGASAGASASAQGPVSNAPFTYPTDTTSPDISTAVTDLPTDTSSPDTSGMITDTSS